MRNLLRLKDYHVNEINEILDLALECKKGKYLEALKGKIVANLFFEPSTRTSYSFQVAEEKLGCKVITFDPGSSSILKGETFYDTVKTFEAFGIDAVVIRSSENQYYKQFEGKLNIPILNAGDGNADHPTQSLLDLMTIKENFGHFDGLKICIVGDIKHSRVAHTNIEVMERLGMDVYVSSPSDYKEDCYKNVELDDIIEDADIIMLLRVQHERHSEKMKLTAQEYNARYGLNAERVAKMKDNAIIMHPAPFNRNVEITDEIVECSRSKIFPQVTNGVFVRMAVLMKAMEE